MCSAAATYAYTAKAKQAWKGKKKGTIIVSYFKGSSDEGEPYKLNELLN